MRSLVDWMERENMGNESLRQVDWEKFTLGTAPQDISDQLEQSVGKFFMTHTVSELFDEAVRKRLFLYPVATIKDITEDSQLADREFWVDLTHPELETKIRYPGALFKASELPPRERWRAPLVGEHNKEIYAELGLSEEEISSLSQRGVI